MRPRKSRNRELPPRFHVKGKACYHVHTKGGKRVWLPIGSTDDLPKALEEWARVERTRRGGGDGRTIADIAQKFTDLMQRADNPFKWADKTKKERARHFRQEPRSRLLTIFGDVHIDELRSHHIADYLEGHPSPVSANREITSLGRMYRWAIRKGWTKEDRNPCQVEKNPEQGRDRYVTDDEYVAVRDMADDWMQCLMDLSLLTSWREMDVARIELKGITDDELRGKESKEGLTARVEMTDALAAVLARARKLRGDIFSPYLFVDRKTHQPFNEDQVKGKWQRRIKKALKDGVISERFTFHDIRAKHASDREDGLEQLALGHTDYKMTKNYVRNRKGRKYTPLQTKVVEDNR